jgi:hypothetical protein
VREVGAEDVHASGLEGKFPLWGGDAIGNVMRLDSALAVAHGFDQRPLADSVEDVVEWWDGRDWPTHWLSAEEESAILAR